MQSFDEMRKPVLTRFSANPEPAASFPDQVQIAMAIADENVLRSLLAECTPCLSPSPCIGAINAKVGVPIPANPPAYGLITFERICCVLARSADELEHHLNQMGDRPQHRFERLTRYETETQTLGHGLSLAQSLTLLAQAGFTPAQIETILTLPYDACHKSWWYTLTPEGQVAMPFHRTIRTRHLADGTFILQYKDHFAQDRPPCFQSQTVSILVERQETTDTFGTTISRLNASRQALGVQQAILIGDRFSELEARGYINQGVSLISAQELRLPAEADCHHCASYDCPMHHFDNSPVKSCYRFYAMEAIPPR